MQTSSLVQGSQRTRLDVRVRFLYLLAREVGELMPARIADREASLENNETGDRQSASATPYLRVIEMLEVGGQLFQTWQEAVEAAVHASGLNLSELVAHPLWLDFTFPAREEVESLRDPSGRSASGA